MKRAMLIIFCAILFACDPYSEARLCNKSGGDISVIIKIDQEFVLAHWQGDQRVRFLKEFAVQSGLIETSIDTISMEGIYRLSHGKCALLYEGISAKPNFILSMLEVNTTDTTLVFDTKKRIESAFNMVSKGRYELNVK
jgi:hypothetical protein